MKTSPAVLCGLLAASLLVARAEILPAAAQDIVDAERAFAHLAQSASTREAFLTYLTAESITFSQGPHKGTERYLKAPVNDSLLEWSPAFVDAAASGNFGYDLGPWTYRNHRADAEPVACGTFVTIWKKQSSGVWRVALDLGTVQPPATESVSATTPASPAIMPSKTEAAHGSGSGLLAAEHDFITRFKQNTIEACAKTFSVEARLYRPGLPPAISPAAISRYFGTERTTTRPVFEVIAGEAASTGDLGFVYGWITNEPLAAGETTTKRSNYLRIWKREDGRSWKIVLDAVGSN